MRFYLQCKTYFIRFECTQSFVRIKSFMMQIRDLNIRKPEHVDSAQHS